MTCGIQLGGFASCANRSAICTGLMTSASAKPAITAAISSEARLENQPDRRDVVVGGIQSLAEPLGHGVRPSAACRREQNCNAPMRMRYRCTYPKGCVIREMIIEGETRTDPWRCELAEICARIEKVMPLACVT